MYENGQDVSMIPYFAHEGEMSRMERANKRLWIVIILLIVCLVGTNMAWVIYESQFQDIIIEQEAETEGNNYLNGTGEMTVYGPREADNQDPGSP